MDAPAPPVVFNPFDPEFIQNPYPFYQQAHASGQAVIKHPLELYFVNRYAEGNALLRAPGTSKAFETTKPGQMMLAGATTTGSTGLLDEERKRWVLQLDGQDHQRIRSLMAISTCANGPSDRLSKPYAL